MATGHDAISHSHPVAGKGTKSWLNTGFPNFTGARNTSAASVPATQG